MSPKGPIHGFPGIAPVGSVYWLRAWRGLIWRGSGMAGPDTSSDDPRDERIGQLLNDYCDRKAAGTAESEEEFLARHRDVADELRCHLDTVISLRTDTSRIDELIARGLLELCDQDGYSARLGPYGISAFLGRGGMGIVLKAYEPSLNRTVALKLLRPEYAADELALRRFEREAKAAGGLRHPNIVTVHAVGQHRGVHYRAMEYVRGPSLADVIRDHTPLPTDFCREVFRQLLAALTTAHDAGLIHRDLKSSNILLDFGLRIAD